MGSVRYVNPSPYGPPQLTDRKGHKDSVLSNPQILNTPLLLLANKQDSPQSLSVEEIRRDYEEWFQNKIENSRRTYEYDSSSDMHHRRERIASLNVMGVSALEGCVPSQSSGFFTELTSPTGPVCEPQLIGSSLEYKIADPDTRVLCTLCHRSELYTNS